MVTGMFSILAFLLLWQTPPKSASCFWRTGANGNATVYGVVVRNETRCNLDAECWLQVDCKGASYSVVYAPSEGEVLPKSVTADPAAWAKATQLAETVRSGTVIEAEGPIKRDRKKAIEGIYCMKLRVISEK